MRGHNIDDLWEQYRASQTAEARNRLFDHYAYLLPRLAARVRNMARSYAIDTANDEDIMNIAAEGLMHAICVFKPEHGVPFERYVWSRGTGHAQDVLRKQDYLKQRDRRLVRAWMAGKPLSEEAAQRASLLASRKEIRLEGADLPYEEDDFERGMMRADMARAIRVLDMLEKSVIEYHYIHHLRMSAIAHLLGLTTAKVNQLHKSALEKMAQSVAAA